MFIVRILNLASLSSSFMSWCESATAEKTSASAGKGFTPSGVSDSTAVRSENLIYRVGATFHKNL